MNQEQTYRVAAFDCLSAHMHYLLTVRITNIFDNRLPILIWTVPISACAVGID